MTRAVWSAKSRKYVSSSAHENADPQGGTAVHILVEGVLICKASKNASASCLKWCLSYYTCEISGTRHVCTEDPVAIEHCSIDQHNMYMYQLLQNWDSSSAFTYGMNVTSSEKAQVKLHLWYLHNNACMYWRASRHTILCWQLLIPTVLRLHETLAMHMVITWLVTLHASAYNVHISKHTCTCVHDYREPYSAAIWWPTHIHTCKDTWDSSSVWD